MPQTNNIVFKNLSTEMSKEQIPLSDIAKGCGIPLAALKKKLNGKEPINLDEALYIAKRFRTDAHYLFQELIEKQM